MRSNPRRWLASFVFAALAISGVARAASFPPHLRFRSVSTPRVTVHFHQDLEALAREAATLATEILQHHEEHYRTSVGRVHVVLADTQDEPNGSATPLPYPLVNVRVVAPDGSDELGNHEGWLRFVLTHELAHVVHLDQARGLLRAGRKVFGRAPFLFPNALTPGWMIEGLATYEETEHTAFGRGRDPDSRMVRRMAALEGDFLREDQAVLALDRWPQGSGLYLFGEAFVRDLSDKFGPDTLPELARVHAGRLLPYMDERTSAKVTGESFHAHWRRWAAESVAAFDEEARALRARGLTVTRPVTSRGVRQTGPRFSPDGTWIAYTSRTLTRYRTLRLVRPDGTGDRRVVRRDGGTAVSWSPDGRTLVFDQPEVQGIFANRSELRAVDVATGRVRRLTRRLRARDPDVSPDGERVVFVRQYSDRSELAVVGLDGSSPHDLTRSIPGTQWSNPGWSPSGDAIAASRWSAGGYLDIVRVDPATGAVEDLTRDRAKDVEPAWTPDGRHLLFRSDRDGVSNLYAIRLSDGALLRITNVLGGAFTPGVSPDGKQVAFASYSARGYDIHLADLDLETAAAAEPFRDPYGAPSAPVSPTTAPDKPYRPLPTMLPRFWSPYSATISGETRYGVATAGADPLFRHLYGIEVHYGEKTRRAGFQGFYQYDRLFPTFTLLVEDDTDHDPEGNARTRALTLRASVPVRRTLRSSQSVSLAWRRERQSVFGTPPEDTLDLGGIEASWVIATAHLYPYSISPVEGWQLRLSYLKEAAALGSDLSIGKLTGDARAYRRLFGDSDVLAVRVGGGITTGQPSFRRSFELGGFPSGVLLDIVGTNLSVLRGYPDDAFSGRRFAAANLEYRFPLTHPQRGFRTIPIFVRHLHGTLFADAGHAWSDEFRWKDVKTGAGAALGADFSIAYGLPVTASLGVARGFADKGETRVYFRVGLSF